MNLAFPQYPGRTDPEPDPPIHTPRIAVILRDSVGTSDVVAVRRSENGVDRRIEAVNPDLGMGFVLHTYGGTAKDVGNDAVPRVFTADLDAQQVADAIWTELEPDLRIAIAFGRAGTPEPASIIQR